MPSRTCSAAAPFMIAPMRVSSCQVPCPGVITNEVPPSRAMPDWNDASVRSDGLKNTSPRILPDERLRLGLRVQPAREIEQRPDLVALEVRQIEETFHARPR